MTSEPEPRIPMLGIEEAREVAKEVGISSAMAGLSVFRVLLRQPQVASALHEMLNTLLWKGTLPPRLRELIILRLGWATGSVYEWTQHWRVATGLKIPEEELLAVRNWRNAEILSDADRAVLAATDETLETGTISRETWALCEAHIEGGAAVLIEMVVAIGNWHLFSSMLRSLEIPLEKGVTPWPPDGKAPPKD